VLLGTFGGGGTNRELGEPLGGTSLEHIGKMKGTREKKTKKKKKTPTPFLPRKEKKKKNLDPL
jgi:hypothetical protein